MVGHVRRAHPRTRTPLRTPGHLEQGTGSYTRGPGQSAGSNLSPRLSGEPPALLQWPPTRQGGNEPLANLKGRRGKKKKVSKRQLHREFTRRGGVTSEGRKGEQGQWRSKQGSGEVGGREGQGEGRGDPAARRERTGGDGEGTRGGQEGSWRGRAGRRGWRGRRTPRLKHSPQGDRLLLQPRGRLCPQRATSPPTGPSEPI